jgi:uncharacterized protein (TIGR00725 family)
MERKRIIGIIGGSEAQEKHLDFAYKVGRLIAKSDAVLVCGGRGGVMEAACRGAVDAEGVTLGILPFDDIETANDYVTIPVATGLGTARNKIIINTGEAFIAIAGRYGTLSEIAYALDAGKRVVGFDTWDIEGVIEVITPEQAVKLAMGEK